MEEQIEKKQIGKEIIAEWYAEKGFSPEGKEKNTEERGEEEDAPTASFVPSVTQKTEEEKKHEEEKKLTVKKEIKILLALAETKGLEKSINEARKKNNPFLLDIYHDVIARDQAFRNFLKKRR